jgi:hypothetical protein
MTFGFQLEEAEICPGTTGLLIDEIPRLTLSTVRPFVWSALLYRTAVRPSEIVSLVSVLCSPEDLKVGAWEEAEADETRSWAEYLAEEVLGDMLAAGLCRYNEEEDLWVLSAGENRRNVPEIIAAVSSLNAELPKHLLLELSKENS